MRIAIVGTRGYPYVYSGYETLVSELSVRLVERGHEVHVYAHKGLFSAQPPVVNGVRVIYLPAVEGKITSQFSHSLLATLHVVFQPVDAVLYVNSANGPFGLITKLFRKRTAINVDGLEWLRPKWKGLGSKYFYAASYLSTKLFDAVVTDSVSMAEIYRKEFNSDSVTIAYGANVAESRNPELLAPLNLKRGEYFLVVGRLIPDNNGELIVKAFEKCSTARKLVILGDVPYKDSYAQEVRRTSDPRIVFPGYVRDQELLRELYCNCYAYVHGHEFGGTNPALLKALAYGSCVLALDTVFNREVLKNGEYGMLFSKEEKDLTTMFDRLDGDEATAVVFRSKARRRITEQYTWEKITDGYMELFSKLTAKK